MGLRPSHRLALTTSCLLVALLAIATAQARRHPMTLPLSHELMEVLSSASATQAHIDQGLDTGGVAQKMRDDRRSRAQAFRGRCQSKSSRRCIEPNPPERQSRCTIAG